MGVQIFAYIISVNYGIYNSILDSASIVTSFPLKQAMQEVVFGMCFKLFSTPQQFLMMLCSIDFLR
jgi:hypothetical protein